MIQLKPIVLKLNIKIRNHSRQEYINLINEICGGHASGKGLLRDKLIEELISCGYKGYTIS